MKLADLKPGDKVKGFEHWGCIPVNATRTVRVCDAGPYLRCKEGRHLLDGQEDAGGELIGLSFA
jgi:hypothetical protein